MPSNYNICTIYQLISNSPDNLFFILYATANMLDRQWYLGKVGIDCTMHLNNN